MNLNSIIDWITSHKIVTGILTTILVVVLIICFLIVRAFSYGYGHGNSGYHAGNVMEMAYADQAVFASKSLSRGSADYAVSDNVFVPEYGEESYDDSIERKLIKNGSLSITVLDIENTRTAIENVVTVHKGFVANEHFNDRNHYNEYGERSSYGKSGNMTIKVPQDSFALVMDEISTMALVVNSESSNTQDVTEQYADLETRLLNKKREEDQYRAILEQAREVSDILEVTQYLERARGEAERLEGQLNVLSNQVELATINVYLESEQTHVFGQVTWNPGYEFKQAWYGFVDALVSFANNVIAIVFFLPILALYLVLALVGLYCVVKTFGFLKSKVRK